MTRVCRLSALAFVAALAVPVWASASPERLLDFQGVVLPGSLGEVLIDSTATEQTTSFDGQPVDLSIAVAGDPGALYVSSFTASWAGAAYAFPFITHDGGTGFPIAPENDFRVGFYSSVDLNALGGAIHIFPTAGYVAAVDGDFEISLGFTYSAPHDPLSSFIDSGLTGSGSFDDFKTFLIDPVIGPYDAESSGDFALSGVTQRVTGVPEPAAWALMLAGFGGIGAAMRARRRTLAVA